MPVGARTKAIYNVNLSGVLEIDMQGWDSIIVCNPAVGGALPLPQLSSQYRICCGDFCRI